MGGYIVILFLVFRLIQAISQNSSARSPSLTVPGKTFLLNWLVGVVLVLPFLIVSVELGWSFTATVGAVAIGIFAPWILARILTIPLGWVRASYVLAWLARFVWRADPQGGAVVAAALARRRRRRVRPSADRFLRRRLERVKTWRGAATLASALLSELDGDLELARAKMWAVDDFDSRVCPALARRLAAQWLLLDAAAQGDWHEVRRRAGHRSLKLDERAWFLAAVTRRLMREDDAPGDFRLRLLWLLAPCRRRTAGLLARALAVPRGPAAEEEETPQDASALLVALHLHVGYLTRASVRHRLGALHRLGEAWQEALDAEELSSLGDFAGSLEAAFAELVTEASPAALAGGEADSLVTAASRSLIESRETELALAVESVADRVRERRYEFPATELEAWCHVRRLYERTARVAGIESRRAAFDTAAADLLDHSAWVFNKHKQRSLGNACFRWLLREAQVTGHVRYAEVLAKNLEVGL